MIKHGNLKDYSLFVYKKIPNMEKLGPTLTKRGEANFIDISLVIFSHESLLEYKTNLKKKLFQSLYYILQMLLNSERFFWGIRYIYIYVCFYSIPFFIIIISYSIMLSFNPHILDWCQCEIHKLLQALSPHRWHTGKQATLH